MPWLLGHTSEFGEKDAGVIRPVAVGFLRVPTDEPPNRGVIVPRPQRPPRKAIRGRRDQLIRERYGEERARQGRSRGSWTGARVGDEREHGDPCAEALAEEESMTAQPLPKALARMDQARMRR